MELRRHQVCTAGVNDGILICRVERKYLTTREANSNDSELVGLTDEPRINHRWRCHVEGFLSVEPSICITFGEEAAIQSNL